MIYQKFDHKNYDKDLVEVKVQQPKKRGAIYNPSKIAPSITHNKTDLGQIENSDQNAYPSIKRRSAKFQTNNLDIFELENEEKSKIVNFIRTAKRKGTHEAIYKHYKPSDYEYEINPLELFGIGNQNKGMKQAI
jgi:hypothetical protein